MGREAVPVCRWQGDVAESKVLLEAQEIIRRGDVRARISRGSISNVHVDDDYLVLTADSGLLVVELGGTEAAEWAAAILRPLSRLNTSWGLRLHDRPL